MLAVASLVFAVRIDRIVWRNNNECPEKNVRVMMCERTYLRGREHHDVDKNKSNVQPHCVGLLFNLEKMNWILDKHIYIYICSFLFSAIWPIFMFKYHFWWQTTQFPLFKLSHPVLYIYIFFCHSFLLVRQEIETLSSFCHSFRCVFFFFFFSFGCLILDRIFTSRK